MKTKNYLFILKKDNSKSSNEAVRRAMKLKVPVLAQYGGFAISVSATPKAAEKLFKTGMFASKSSAAINSFPTEKLSKQQNQILNIWNASFDPKYKKSKKDSNRKQAKSWATKRLKEPSPPMPIDIDQFTKIFEKKTKKSTKQIGHKYQINLDPKKWKPEYFKYLIEYFEVRFKDPKLAYTAALTFYHVHDIELRERFLDDSQIMILHSILVDIRAEDSCWKMSGRNSVGIVFVESSQPGGPKFGTTERNQICNEIVSGISWLSSEHPGDNLTWIFDFQFTEIDAADKSNLSSSNTSYDSYWREPAIGQIQFEGHTFNSDDEDMVRYRNEMRFHHDSEHAFLFFVTPYGTSWHAYSAGSSYISLAKHGDNWGEWGQNSIDRISVHEVCHKYGAADEYTGNGTPCSSCGGQHGCDNIPNGNCQSCADPGEVCVMHTDEISLCQYTRAQIGWSDIFVELTTSNTWNAGTDDAVTFNIGNSSRSLNIPGYDDRERGNKEGHALWFGGKLSRSSIKHILLKKSDDGWAGGWKLSKIKVYHDGVIICDKSPNKWIEDDDLMYLGCSFDDNYVHSLEVRIKTADSLWAGTDDDVSFSIGSRSWDLNNKGNDRERNDSDTYKLYPGTGFRVSDITSFCIRKSSDGWGGGWKLGQVRIRVNGTTIYNNTSINEWLENSDRSFCDDI